MDPRKQLLITLSALALSAGGLSYSAQSAALQQCAAAGGDRLSEEECACLAALQEHSIEALEEFIRKYGDRGDSACMALALSALNDFTRPDNDRDPPDMGGGSPY